MTRRTARSASHCGQLDSTALECAGVCSVSKYDMDALLAARLTSSRELRRAAFARPLHRGDRNDRSEGGHPQFKTNVNPFTSRSYFTPEKSEAAPASRCSIRVPLSRGDMVGEQACVIADTGQE